MIKTSSNNEFINDDSDQSIDDKANDSVDGYDEEDPSENCNDSKVDDNNDDGKVKDNVIPTTSLIAELHVQQNTAVIDDEIEVRIKDKPKKITDRSFERNK